MTIGLLTMAYSTLATRVDQISLVDDGSDVEVLICVQGGLPSGRDEWASVRVVEVPGIGVAKSRNAAIEHARSRYLLFCDDDVQVDLAGVVKGVEHLKRTGRAIVLGQGMDPSGALRKRYPSSVVGLTRMNTAKAATYEMLIDVTQVRAAGVRFDERFGAGSTFYLGDEYVFICDLLKAGLFGDAIPVVFGTHPATSSGSQWGTSEDVHARAVVLNRIFGAGALWVRIAFGLKHWRRLGGWSGFTRLVTDRTRP